MNILAIETSCDETAISIIRTDTFNTPTPNFTVLSNLVISQINVHAEYGGVFPALAKREHAKNLVPLLEQALREANVYQDGSHDVDDTLLENILEREPTLYQALKNLFASIERPRIDMVMVTYGPGLAPALWVGVNFARALSIAWNIPIVPVNHMEGHITSILLKDDYMNESEALLPLDQYIFPMLALLVSGGHTQLVLVRDWCTYEIIGETLDDAVGEAFDKTARMLGMEYPGGPKISQAALEGKENESINLPRPMIHSEGYNFSFSGLKTSVRYLVEELEQKNELNEQTINDIAREFEHAVADVLLAKTCKAIETYTIRGLIVAGGVSANTFLTASFKEKMNEYSIPLYIPETTLCGDNSLMIATAGFIQYWRNKTTVSESELVAVGNLKL
ncbi:tRNA (adenosine(37)-N6)-threonylcarbamoyltransferase complex transferase subunit TsaD [Patescibacteria group bacterium]|nr:tRNA (adenosine(37)-N6)-threonylcarbamoyltransferase complex transferase subunit TsaD [Patescibacteria group bacterium]